MPSDAWTDQETQLLKRAVRAVPSDLEKNDRWRQVAVLVGGGRGKKECYEYWKAINKAKAAPVIRRPPDNNRSRLRLVQGLPVLVALLLAAAAAH